MDFKAMYLLFAFSQDNDNKIIKFWTPIVWYFVCANPLLLQIKFVQTDIIAFHIWILSLWLAIRMAGIFVVVFCVSSCLFHYEDEFFLISEFLLHRFYLKPDIYIWYCLIRDKGSFSDFRTKNSKEIRVTFLQIFN